MRDQENFYKKIYDGINKEHENIDVNEKKNRCKIFVTNSLNLEKEDLEVAINKCGEYITEKI